MKKLKTQLWMLLGVWVLLFVMGGAQAQLASDTFLTASATLAGRTATGGGTWSAVNALDNSAAVSATAGEYSTVGAYGLYLHSIALGTNNYTVSADMTCYTNGGASATPFYQNGIAARIQSNGDCYALRFVSTNGAGQPAWGLSKITGNFGTVTAIQADNVVAGGLTVTHVYHVTLTVNGSSISATYRDVTAGGATTTMSGTDTGLTTGGAGVVGYGAESNSAGFHLTNWRVDALAPSFVASPASINTSSSTTLTLTGTNTAWTSGTTFSVSGVSGASIVTNSINVGAQTASVTITTGSTGGTLTISDNTDSATTAVTVNKLIAVNNTLWYWSPWAWKGNGSAGSLQANNCQSDATTQTGTNIAYFKATLNGSTTIKLPLTVTTTNTVAAQWSIDGGAFTGYGGVAGAYLPVGTTTIDLLNGSTVSSGSAHSVWFIVSRTYVASLDRWTGTPVGTAYTLSGMILDAGGSLVSPSTLTGYQALPVFSTNVYINVDSWGETNGIETWAFPFIQSFGEGCDDAYSAMGWDVAVASNNVPAFVSGNVWSNYWSGASRLYGGKLSPIPSLWLVCLGENDANLGGTQARVTTAVSSFATSARSAVNTATDIVLCVPPSGYTIARTGLLNAQTWTLVKTINFTDIYKSSSDAHLWLVDPSQHNSLWAGQFTGSFASRYSSDFFHPATLGQYGQYGGILQAACSYIQNATAAPIINNKGIHTGGKL